MGKIVVKNNRIVYAEIMDPAETPNYMVVMENKDGQLKGVNAENENFKKDLRKDQDYDYSIVYNTKGEKLDLKDIEEGNVLYVQQHNYDGDDVAHVVVVQDNKIEGELGKVKHDRAEIDSKELKVVKFQRDADEELTYVASYAINDLEEVRTWNFSSEWEDDMEDAYKETIVAYKDAVGRIAFLTTDGGNSGYKFGIITRTYADSDRIRIFTTIDGKEGKDQIFKADKELDIQKPIELDSEGLEPKDIKDARTEAKIGMAVKFRLNSDGEIAKEKLFVMPIDNVYGMTDDFGKDIIKAIKVDNYDNTKPDGKNGDTFAVNSDAINVIDAPKVGIKFEETIKENDNLDGKNMGHGKIDIDDFDVTTWKDIKEDNQDDKIRFYIFPKNNKKHEVDGLVFIGKDGANTGSDEEAVYVLDQWKKGDKLFVEYVKYPENEKITREVDETDKKIEKERAYVGKEKSNGKIALTRDDKKAEDFDLYLGQKVEKVNGNYIYIGVDKDEKQFLLTNSLVYDEDKSKTTSYIRKGMKVDIVTDGIRARVVGVLDNDGKGDSETNKTDVKGELKAVGKDSKNRPIIKVGTKTYTLADAVELVAAKDVKYVEEQVGSENVATELERLNKAYDVVELGLDLNKDGEVTKVTVLKLEKDKKIELKEDFLDAAKAQTSLDEDIYSLNFDGKKLGVTFKESGLEKDPVTAVKTAANAMLDKVLEVVDEATITVNEKDVTVSKENKNIEALAKAFLGETEVENFIKDGKVEVSFTTKISKGDIKDVEVGEVNATFAMDMDLKKAKEEAEELGIAIDDNDDIETINEKIETANKLMEAADAAIAELNDEAKEVYEMTFDKKSKKADITFKTTDVESVKTQGSAMLGKIKAAGVTKIIFGDENSVEIKDTTTIGNLFDAVVTAAGKGADNIKAGEKSVELSDITVVAKDGTTIKGFSADFKFNLPKEKVLSDEEQGAVDEFLTDDKLNQLNLSEEDKNLLKQAIGDNEEQADDNAETDADTSETPTARGFFGNMLASAKNLFRA